MLKDLKKDEFKLTLIQCSSGLNIIVYFAIKFLGWSDSIILIVQENLFKPEKTDFVYPEIRK